MRTSVVSLLVPVLATTLAFVTAAKADTALPYRDLGADRCFDFSALIPPRQGKASPGQAFNVMIMSRERLSTIISAETLRASCDNAAISTMLSSIDFSKQVVLGLWTEGDCSTRQFRKTLTVDEAVRTMTYAVTIISSPKACMGPGLQSLNLIVVPRIASGYRVLFKVRSD